MNYPNELVEAVKAVADAINGEGGGGGEIITAEVTIKNPNGYLDVNVLGAVIEEFGVVPYIEFFNNDDKVVTSPIVNEAVFMIPDDSAYALSVVSGNATTVGNGVQITGDCVIQLNMQST